MSPGSSRTRQRVPGICLALAAALWACQAAEDPVATEGRKPAPDFVLPDLSGNPVQLSTLRGKTVVIDFWATWCPPCIYQVPELNALWNAHAGTGDLAVIGVAVDVEGAEVVAPWVEEQGVDYTIVIGDEALAREFGVLGFPTLVLVNPEGEIDSLHVGLIEHEELEELVERAVAAASAG